MGLAYGNLDSETRAFMIEEIRMAVADSSIYLSPWLTENGVEAWSGLLEEAARTGSDNSLATELRNQNLIRETAERRKPKGGGMTTYRVPDTAPATMAEGEFNRFYCRGLCRRAIADGVKELEVYRAKQVKEPRAGSEEKIGTRVDPAAILADLRTSPGVEPTLGLPPGPNSGLTLRLPN